MSLRSLLSEREGIEKDSEVALIIDALLPLSLQPILAFNTLARSLIYTVAMISCKQIFSHEFSRW